MKFPSPFAKENINTNLSLKQKNALMDEIAIAPPSYERNYRRALDLHKQWHGLWNESYDHALPQHNSFGFSGAGQRKTDHLYDGTAPDAVEQLAASLMGNLTPPWSQWFGFKPGNDLSPNEKEALSPILEKAAKTIQSHLDRSNFLIEIHQCFLDLIVGGTAALAVESEKIGAFSALKFKSIPLSTIAFLESDDGRLNESYRHHQMSYEQIIQQFKISPSIREFLETRYKGSGNDDKIIDLLEIIQPDKTHGFEIVTLLYNEKIIISRQKSLHAPIIGFRWLKAAGEIYGRSPVMKALPDIKTANKVVELILKNASISVTGIWQADDDGILNIANIELKAGAIIPKAVGSDGLKPLEMPGRFDVSQLVLEDLRARIRHALLMDRFPTLNSSRMTATEVLERTAEMALLLGATYGRLQSELLTPLIKRIYSILRKRGEVPDIEIDGQYVVLDYRSPLARAQAQRNINNILSWVGTVTGMGAEAAKVIDFTKTAQYLGDTLGVPSDLIRNVITIPEKNTDQTV
jgi:hypothetical protein